MSASLPVHCHLPSPSFLPDIGLDIQPEGIAVQDCTLDLPLGHSSRHTAILADLWLDVRRRALLTPSQAPRLHTKVVTVVRDEAALQAHHPMSLIEGAELEVEEVSIPLILRSDLLCSSELSIVKDFKYLKCQAQEEHY